MAKYQVFYKSGEEATDTLKRWNFEKCDSKEQEVYVICPTKKDAQAWINKWKNKQDFIIKKI